MEKYEKWVEKRISEIENCGDSYNELGTFGTEIGAIYCAGFITREQFFEAHALATEARDRVRESIK